MKLLYLAKLLELSKRLKASNSTLFGTIPSDKVKNVTFVPVNESSRKTCLNEIVEDGYQRPGSLTRMRAFARFLKENPNSIVPPVLLLWPWEVEI